jgi:hypothetical protein
MQDWHAFHDKQKKLEDTLKWKERKQQFHHWLLRFGIHVTPTIITVTENEASSSRRSQDNPLISSPLPTANMHSDPCKH